MPFHIDGGINTKAVDSVKASTRVLNLSRACRAVSVTQQPQTLWFMPENKTTWRDITTVFKFSSQEMMLKLVTPPKRLTEGAGLGQRDNT